MKNNVDLTENLDFRFKAKDFFANRRGFSSSSYSDAFEHEAQCLHDTLFDKFDVPKDNFFTDKDSGGVLQGDAYDRKHKLKCNEFCDGKTCDCCGRKLWIYDGDTLCDSCKEMIYTVVHTRDIRDNFS